MPKHCQRCNEPLPNDGGIAIQPGTSLCTGCFNKVYTHCHVCHKLKPVVDGVAYRNWVFCASCAWEHLFRCDICMEYRHKQIDGYHKRSVWELCDKCYASRRELCVECGRICENSKHHNANGYYCESCVALGVYDEACVLDAGYRPREMVFMKEAWENTTYFGIELEVEKQGTVGAGDFMDGFGDKNLYLKHDSSLYDGFEIVSHPATAVAHKKFGWREILTWLQENGFDSFSAGTCGLHIHINREAFTQRSLLNFVTFIERTREQMFRFSKRDEESCDDFARFADEDELFLLLTRGIIPCGRYRAVNNENEHTVEFRLPRGTLINLNFRAFIVFCELLVRYAKMIGVTHLRTQPSITIWKGFVEFAKREGYQHLVEVFKRREVI